MLTSQELQDNIESAAQYRERRHPQWSENYRLYRDTVITNRLTQRQSVNVPLMKETLRTIRANIAPISDLTFESLDNDKQKELFKNEYWRWVAKQNRLTLLDYVDTNQELLYGRSFIKLNIVDGQVKLEVLDPQDILIDRFTDPTDIDSARYVIHQHIFKTIGELEMNPLYSREAVSELKRFYGTKLGMIKADENAQIMRDRNERLETMGDTHVNDPLLGATYVELNEHIVKEYNSSKKEFEHHVYVTADGRILMHKTLKEVLGIDFFPYVTWADDLERTDFWSDGVADIVRVPNQVLNVWMSQLVENRTMRNFGMQFFDASKADGWTPAGYTPGPFAFFPLPGKPSEFLSRVEVPELSESLDEMQFLIGMTERATAATGIEKGSGTENEITLGEVKLLASKAMNRISDISRLKLQRDEELGEKFDKLTEANAGKLDAVKLYKKSAQGNYWPREVKPTDWKSKAGYRVRVVSAAQKESESLDKVQKLRLGVQEFPANVPFRKIYQELILDLADLTPDQKKEVLDFEEQAASQMAAMPQQPGMDPSQLLAPQPAQINA
jgi:hypothetical protein